MIWKKPWQTILKKKEKLIKTIVLFIAKTGKIGCHNGRNPK